MTRAAGETRRGRIASGLGALARWTAAASLALLAAGCAAIDPPAAPPAASLAPAAAPQTTGGALSSPERKRLIDAFGGEYSAPTTERYLNEILARLAPASETPTEPYRVTILDSPVVNAFALPTGEIFITRGLLTLANDSSEVAAVMAHEIGHITAHHAMLRAEEEKRAAVISQAASVIQSREKGEEVAAVEQRTIASFSRQQELDADQIGIRSIAAAGYDPYAASRFLDTMERARQLHAAEFGQTASQPDLLSTHPSTPERVQRAIAVAKEIGPPGTGTTDRTAYLAAIDGMMYGDDPVDGAIRGRTFIHPRLGFLFMAPQGFVLENSAQAVLGVKSGGLEAMRLDSVKVADDTSLESYIGSGWIDGLLRSSVQSITVNGMPAVTAIARAGEWNFRIVVIRFDSSLVYRMIFAIHNLNEDAEARFRESIDSFRHITPDEAAKVRGLGQRALRARR